MNTNSSIERKLVVRIFFILSIYFMAFYAIIYYRSNVASGEINEKLLETMAFNLSRSISTDKDGTPAFTPSKELSESIRDDPYDSIFIIKSRDGKSRWISNQKLQSISLDWNVDGDDGNFIVLNDVLEAGDTYYGISRIYNTKAGPFIISVASSGNKRDFSRFILSEFIVDISWVVPVFLIIVIGTIVATVRSSLRSVSQTSSIAASIQPNATDIRLTEDNVPVEILPLVVAVNRAFERLDAGFQAERRFTANAAHELRTPLAILKARISDLQSTVSDETFAEIEADVDRMARLVGQLLAIARLETHHMATEKICNANDAARDAVAALAPLAIAKSQEISAQLPEHPVSIGMPYAQLYEAVRNLIENAIEHCGTGATIAVTLNETGTLAVIDDGPGIADAEKALVFERFFRKTRNGSTSSGAGLGLAIIAEILKQHDGSITVKDTPGGGATMEMRLPKAPK